MIVLVALAGGLGAASRFLVDDLVNRWLRRDGRVQPLVPWATILVNVSGSLLLGLLVGAAAGRALEPDLLTVAGTGFCGGYTTFSTAMVETFRLAQRRRPGLAALSILGSSALCMAAAAAGWALMTAVV